MKHKRFMIARVGIYGVTFCDIFLPALAFRFVFETRPFAPHLPGKLFTEKIPKREVLHAVDDDAAPQKVSRLMCGTNKASDFSFIPAQPPADAATLDEMHQCTKTVPA